MNSRTPLYFTVLSIFSQTSFSLEANACNIMASNSNVVCINNVFSSVYGSPTVSFTEQYIPPVDYKARYRRIAASAKFIDAYYNRSLGESILIED